MEKGSTAYNSERHPQREIWRPHHVVEAAFLQQGQGRADGRMDETKSWTMKNLSDAGKKLETRMDVRQSYEGKVWIKGCSPVGIDIHRCCPPIKRPAPQTLAAVNLENQPL